MPLYDFQCGTCDRVFEAYVSLADWPKVAPCPTDHTHTDVVKVQLPKVTTWTVPEAVVVYKAPDGSFRFPGENDGMATAKYDRMGYTRVEARGFAEVRSLERKMNQQESDQMRRMDEAREARREHGSSMRRSELFRLMPGMSRIGRDLARAAIERGNRRAAYRAGDPGLHVEAYSMDRSNREAGRERDGRRTRD